jgi:hypothetical protein
MIVLIPDYFVPDERPPKGCWASGEYLCECINCDRYFAGDKRALMCADCAYAKPTEPTGPQ